MKSVERHGDTVSDATAAALAALGATEDTADIEVLSRPRRGILGRGRKATVRATLKESRVHPPDPAEQMVRQQEAVASTLPPGATSEKPASDDTAAAAPTDEKAEVMTTDLEHVETSDGDDQRPGASEEAAGTEGVELEEMTPEERVELLDEECDLAADFIEGLLDLLDMPGDIVIEATDESAVVNVVDVGSGLLIGRRGATLDALQELVRSSTQRQTERRSHVRVDVEGYRARHLDKLRTKCRDAIAQVRETGEPYKLEPMDAYERKMMHDLVAKTGGVTSSSEGSEPRRRVVIAPQ